MVPSGTKMQEALVRDEQRLIEGFVAAISEKSFSSTTIADIVRHARLSKRSFYQCFSDKEACFLAAYSAISDQLLRTIEAAADPELSWRQQVRVAARAYIAALEAQPALTRTFFLEIMAVGPKALELRREVNRRFADLLRGLVARARKSAENELKLLSPPMATAVVGGINELILECIADGGGGLSNVEKTAVHLLTAVIQG